MKGASSLPPYNPIEVINYFIKIEHENELNRYTLSLLCTCMPHYVARNTITGCLLSLVSWCRLRVVTPPPAPPPEPEEELPHNTVVTLPKITR